MCPSPCRSRRAKSAFLNAGDYTFTASFAEGDNALGNYTLPDVVTEDYTMRQAAVTVTIGMAPQTYDGQTHTTIEAVRGTHYTVTEGTVYGEDNLNVTLTVNGGTGAKNVGTYSVSAAAENENYDVTFADETDAFVISPAKMTVSGITDQNYTFDGQSYFERATENKKAAVVDGTPVWTFSLTYDAGGAGYTATLGDEELLHAGSDTVYYRVTEPNHETETGSFTVDIAQCSVAAVWTDTAFTYDGTNQITRVTAHYVGVDGEVGLTVTLTAAARSRTGAKAATTLPRRSIPRRIRGTPTTRSRIRQKITRCKSAACGCARRTRAPPTATKRPRLPGRIRGTATRMRRISSLKARTGGLP